VCWLGLSHSAAEKLAKLLLEWSSKNGEGAKAEPRLKLRLTHEEIAQILGLSRESVTRVFADFRKQRLIRQNGSTLVIPDRVALKSLITN
jgi:CRP/FNR family transcriptional regulator